MQTYSLIEKLAIVKTLDEIIIANGEIAPGEQKMLKEIMNKMAFNAAFVEEARKMKSSESIDVLKRMPLKRKKLFAELMHKIAISDGTVDEMETNLIIGIYKDANIDIESPEHEDVNLDLSYLHFEAKGYFDYPEGMDGKREYLDEPKLIKIEPVLNTSDLYSLMIYDALQSESLWGRDITFKPVHLNVIKNQDGLITFSSDAFRGTDVFVYHKGPDIEKVGLNMAVPYRMVEYVK